MWKFSFLVIFFLKPSKVGAPCPLACICRQVTHDSFPGQLIDCNSLFKNTLPGQSKLNSGTALELHFRYNSLREFPNRLKNFTQLRILDLSKNRLSTLNNNTFRFLGNLKKLNLSGNYLTLIGVSTFIGLHRLQLLDLSRNDLEVVPSDILQFWTEGNADHKQVCLDRNRWVCDCSLIGFMKWYISHVTSGVIDTCDGNPLPECRAPPHLSQRGFDTSTVSEISMCDPIPATTNYHVTTTLTTQSDPSTSFSSTEDHITSPLSGAIRDVTSQVLHEIQLSEARGSSASPFSTTTKTSHHTNLWVLEGELVMYGALIAIVVIFVLLLVFAAVLCRMAQRQKILETVTTSDPLKLTTDGATGKSLQNKGEPALSPKTLHYDRRLSGDYAEIPAFTKINNTTRGHSDIPQIDAKHFAFDNKPAGTYTWQITSPQRSSWKQHSPPDLRKVRQEPDDSPPSRNRFRQELHDNAYHSIPVNNSEYQSRIYKF